MRPTVTIPLALILAATGCSTTSGPGGAATEKAANLLVSVEEENRLGEQMAAKIAQEQKLLEGTEVAAYVSELGQRIASQAEQTPEGIDYRFHVIDDPDMVNAFAIPGGHIYVYTGLLRTLQDEAELTAVLSHEVAHVAERHVAERLVAAYGLEIIKQLALGQDAGILGQLVSSVGSQGYLLKHSRDAERQADRVGVEYQVAAGYDPHGFVDFFQRLEGGRGLTFLQSHPSPENRIETIRAQIGDMGEVPTQTNPQRYQAKTSNLAGASK